MEIIVASFILDVSLTLWREDSLISSVILIDVHYLSYRRWGGIFLWFCINLVVLLIKAKWSCISNRNVLLMVFAIQWCSWVLISIWGMRGRVELFLIEIVCGLWSNILILSIRVFITMSPTWIYSLLIL